MMIVSIKITPPKDSRLATITDPAKKLFAPMVKAFHQGALEVMGVAVKTRFTGKGPFPVAERRLGVRSNLLRKSLRATAVQVQPNTGQAAISMGSNVSYFAPHEFGLRGKIQVAAHTRKTVADRRNSRGRITRKSASSLKAAKARGRANYANVRAHSRRVNIPARRPLGTQLESIQTRATFYRKFKAVLSRFLSRP